MFEGLVVREVARARPREHRTDQAGKGTAHAAGGLDVFRRALGLTVDGHQAQAIHVHTDRQHVGRQHHVDGASVTLVPLRHELAGGRIERSLELDLQMVEILRDVLTGDARGQLADVVHAALRERGSLDHAHLHAVGTCLHVVLGQAPHPAQFAQGVEVADHRHVRVGGLAEAVEQGLGRGEEGGIDADQHRRPRAAGRTHTQIAPPWSLLDRALHREVVVFHVQAMRREDRHAPHEHIVHLFFGFAHGRRGCDDLRFDRLAVEHPAGQFIDSGFVQADHRAQWAADEVEFVLDDQIGRTDRCDVFHLDRWQAFSGGVIPRAIAVGPQQTVAFALLMHTTEQRAHLPAPRHHGKLVHGGDHHRRRTMVDFLVHRQHGDAGVR